MRKLALIIVVAGLVAGGGSALALSHTAKSPTARADYASCIKKARTTVAAEACINAEIKRLTGLLNSAYKTLLTNPGVSKTALAAAENRWVAFRAADCKFAGTLNAGGSLQPIDTGTCMVDLTSTRLIELRNYEKQAPH